MPRYKVARDCYGFLERLWTEGTVVDITDPPENLPRHFEPIKLLPGEKAWPVRKNPAAQLDLATLLRIAEKGILSADQSAELIKKVAELQAQALSASVQRVAAPTQQAAPPITPPLDLVEDPDEEDDEVLGPAEKVENQYLVQDGSMKVSITPPPPEVEEINVGGTKIVVKAKEKESVIPKINASPKKSGPQVSIQAK